MKIENLKGKEKNVENAKTAYDEAKKEEQLRNDDLKKLETV